MMSPELKAKLDRLKATMPPELRRKPEVKPEPEPIREVVTDGRVLIPVGCDFDEMWRDLPEGRVIVRTDYAMTAYLLTLQRDRAYREAAKRADPYRLGHWGPVED